jgi:ApbE superfamily uncharacterized protein (UPF0280 family)
MANGPKLPRPDEYRSRVTGTGLVSFRIQVEQTDLFIRAQTDLADLARDRVFTARSRILAWAESQPDFLTSLAPLSSPVPAPQPVRAMLAASRTALVGPMAAVAGAIAQFVGETLLERSPEAVVVENGGDIWLAGTMPQTVGLFAGASPLSMKLGLYVTPDRLPAGICTSSGTLGHSYSQGRADAATVAADSGALADAAATALGNRVRGPQDIEPALEWVTALPGVRGGVVIVGDRIGFLGDIEVRPL